MTEPIYHEERFSQAQQDFAFRLCCFWGVHSSSDYQEVIRELTYKLEKLAEIEFPDEDEREDLKQETVEFQVIQNLIRSKQILKGRFPSKEQCAEFNRTRTARGGTRHNMPKKRCHNSTKRNRVTGKSAKKRCHNSTKRNRVTGKSAKKRCPTGTRRN
jgi:hypothetical protein